MMTNIYSTVPRRLTKGEQTKINKEKVIKYFENHIGKSNAKALNKISQELGFQAKGNSAGFRKLVATLVEDDLYPIVSCSKGYFKAEKLTEIEQNISSEIKRIKGLQRRIQALSKIKLNMNNKKTAEKKWF